MTLIPETTLTRWRNRSRRSALETLENLLEFRTLAPEFKAENCLMQAYNEAAESMMMSGETLRDYMGKIREYTAEQLRNWIENGISFDHMEKAARLAEVAHKTPERLLNEALDPGNETGAPMTVREMVTFAMSEVPQQMKAETYHFTVLYERLGKFPNRFGWERNKAERFNSWLEQGKEFFN